MGERSRDTTRDRPKPRAQPAADKAPEKREKPRAPQTKVQEKKKEPIEHNRAIIHKACTPIQEPGKRPNKTPPKIPPKAVPRVEPKMQPRAPPKIPPKVISRAEPKKEPGKMLPRQEPKCNAAEKEMLRKRKGMFVKIGEEQSRKVEMSDNRIRQSKGQQEKEKSNNEFQQMMRELDEVNNILTKDSGSDFFSEDKENVTNGNESLKEISKLITEEETLVHISDLSSADKFNRIALNRMKMECDRMFKVIPHFDSDMKIPAYTRTIFDSIKKGFYHRERCKTYPNSIILFEYMGKLNKFQREIQWEINSIFKPDIKHLGGNFDDRIKNYGTEKCIKVEYQPGISREFIFDSVLHCYILRDMEDWHHKLAVAYLLKDMNIVQLQKMHNLYDTVDGSRLATFMVKLKGLHYNMPFWMQAVPPARDLPELISRVMSEFPSGEALTHFTYGISIDFINTRLKMDKFDFTTPEGFKVHEILDHARERIEFTINSRNIELHVCKEFDSDGSLDSLLQKILANSYAIEYKVSYNNKRKMFVEDSKGDLLFRIELNPVTRKYRYFCNGSDISNQFHLSGKIQSDPPSLIEELNHRYQNEIGNFNLSSIGISEEFKDLFLSIRLQNSDRALNDYFNTFLKKDSEYITMYQNINDIINLLDSNTPYIVGSEKFDMGLRQYMALDGRLDEGGTFYKSFELLVTEMKKGRDCVEKHWQFITLLKEWCVIEDQTSERSLKLYDDLVNLDVFGSDTPETIKTLRNLWMKERESQIEKPLKIDNFDIYNKILHPGRGGYGIRINPELTLSAYLAGDPSVLRDYINIPYLNKHLNHILIPELSDDILSKIKEQKITLIKPLGWGPIRFAKIQFFKSLMSECFTKSNNPSDWLEWLAEGENYRWLHYALNGVSYELIHRQTVQDLVQILKSNDEVLQNSIINPSFISKEILLNNSPYKFLEAIFTTNVSKLQKI